jgi:hypothetical protein
MRCPPSRGEFAQIGKRREHERFANSAEHKSEVPLGEDGLPDWEGRARTALFQSKRARRLADLLRARRALDAQLPVPTVEGLRALLDTGEGRWVVGHLARRDRTAHRRRTNALTDTTPSQST